MKTPIYFVLTALALVSLACSLTVNLPPVDRKTGPVRTEEIRIPLPDSSADRPAELELSFGAGELRLRPGAEDAWVQGEAIYNVVDFKPVVTVNGDRATIEAGNLEISGLPSFRGEYRHEWDLRLGADPMRLRLTAGGYKGNLELGGLALDELYVTDGAGEIELNFAEPNPITMNELRYETGGSTVRLSGLANANFEELIFKAGAGSYTLDFGGDLRQDATVTIDAGASSVIIIVPKGTAARVFFDGGLSNVDVSGDWRKDGSDYYMDGDGPVLTINVNMGLGSLELRNR